MEKKLNIYKQVFPAFLRIFGKVSIGLTFILIWMFSCTDLVEIDSPKNELVRGVVFENDATANATMAGVYSDMAFSSHYVSGYINGLKMATSQTSDEYNVFFGSEGFFENEIDPDNTNVRRIWQRAYNTIYSVNAILEGIADSDALSSSLGEQLEGEAKFLRAFNYFYLVNLFGDLPLITSTDFEENRLASRTPVSQVYDLILSDLKEAYELLPEDYAHAEGERVRANKAVAAAMLARVYLYLEDWSTAETTATTVINNPVYGLENDLNKVFLADSAEAIWQLLPYSAIGNNAPEAILSFFAPFSSSFGSFTEQLTNAFEENDNRKTVWVGTDSSESYLYAFKYKARSTGAPPFTEYSIHLRLAEQYLIRAEARAQQGNLTGAIADIDIIRGRAGLPLIQDTNPGISQTDLMLAIEQERRIELFTEGGHRWLDLKRWGKADEVLGPVKPMWEPTDVLYPIPQNELERNPNLTQNPGYPEF